MPGDELGGRDDERSPDTAGGAPVDGTEHVEIGRIDPDALAMVGEGPAEAVSLGVVEVDSEGRVNFLLDAPRRILSGGLHVAAGVARVPVRIAGETVRLAEESAKIAVDVVTHSAELATDVAMAAGSAAVGGPLTEVQRDTRRGFDPLAAIAADLGTESDHERPWERWTSGQRRLKMVLVSIAVTLAPFSTNVYLPSLGAVARDLGTDATGVALTLSSYTLAAGIMPLIWGPLSDRHGRRWIMFGALLTYVLTSAVAAFSQDLLTLMAARGLQALGVSATFVVGAGVIADTHPPEERGLALGWVGVAPLVGVLLGPVLGGIIAEVWDWRTIFWLLTAVGAVMLIWVSFGLPETLPASSLGKGTTTMTTPLRLLADPGVRRVAALATVAFCAMYYLVPLLSLQLERVHGMDASDIGYAFLPFGLAGIVGTIAGGFHTDRFGLWPTILVGGILAAAGLLWMSWALDTPGRFWHIMGGTVLIGFGASYGRPALMASAIMRVGRAGSVTGLLTFGTLVGASLVAPYATWAHGHWGALQAAIPLLILLLATMAWLLSKKSLLEPELPVDAGIAAPVAAAGQSA